MIRALLELFVTILAVVVARAVLTSIMKGIANASTNAFQTQHSSTSTASATGQTRRQAQSGGDLHRDPVCGTFVAESTPFRRQQSGQMFYYCSDACREKHALVAR
jgi:hypothetical protein